MVNYAEPIEQEPEDSPPWQPPPEKMATTVCPNGHTYPIMAGECPYDDLATAAFLELSKLEVKRDTEVRLSSQISSESLIESLTVLLGVIPPHLYDWMQSECVTYMDNGRAPRTIHDYGHYKKLGLANHIPVCQTLGQLDNYYNGGNAQGSTHFGNGRTHDWDFVMGNYRIPLSSLHQYMPLRGVSPWAQGVIATNANCPIPQTSAIAGMRSGEPNGAFASCENVAMTGAEGLTDPQFNTLAFLRAYLAVLDDYPITPTTQLWHSEIDQLNRCNDPGWSGDLEDANQAAAVLLINGDVSGLRGVTLVGPPPAPNPVVPSGISANMSLMMNSLFPNGTLVIPKETKPIGPGYWLYPNKYVGLNGPRLDIPEGTIYDVYELWVPKEELR